MPWWLWVVIILLGLLGFFQRLRTSWRTSVRMEYAAYLKEHGVQVVGIKKNSLKLKIGDSEEIKSFLHNVYGGCLQAANTTEARREVYARFLAMLREGAKAGGPLDIAVCGEKILPRLVPEGFFDRSPDGVHQPFVRGSGLSIAYVLDHPHSVSYILTRQLGELGLDLEGIHELALSNLEKTFSGQAVAEVLAKGSVSVVKSADSHDVARVLLVPKHLPAGAKIVALIPDRDNLTLLPAPEAEKEWGGIRKLARNAAGRPLLKKPLLVTREGFTVV